MHRVSAPRSRTSGVGNIGLASNYTNITIASMEDLGGGLKLDFAAQIDWNTVEQRLALSNRNSHIGLVGENWGGVWYGSNENIYERYFYTQDPLDGAAGLGGNLQIMGTPGGAVFQHLRQRRHRRPTATRSTPGCGYTWYRRDAQAIWYDSPNWNGFTFGAVFQTNFDKQSQPNADVNPYMWQLGAKYVGTSLPAASVGCVWPAQGPVRSARASSTRTKRTAGAAANTIHDRCHRAARTKAWQLGVGWTLGDIYFFGVYERLKYEPRAA